MTGLFPPQEIRWHLDPAIGLTPQATAKVCREAAQIPFEQASASINEDWGTNYDGRQIQRWSEHVGEKVVGLQEAERKQYAKGQHPEGPANASELLVIGLDGGRVQGRKKDRKTKSRWMEDKVATVSSCLKGDGKQRDPQRLLTTVIATMNRSKEFGVLARLEAERRGLRQALEVIVIGDGAAWIDTIAETHFTAHVRIIDYYHAVERLCDCAKAVEPRGSEAWAKRLETQLWEGQLPQLLSWLEEQVKRVGRVRAKDPDNHPRRVLAENLTYFRNHQEKMNYPVYRARGWPIGSGITESGVKRFNKRVKGTEQFWHKRGVNAILALRALRLSDDTRWENYMLTGQLLRPAA